MNKVSILVAPLLIFISACSLFQRHPNSGYSSNLTSKNYKSSLNGSSVETKVNLKRLENAISTDRELEQYSKALPYFKSDEEKVEFLAKETFEERQRFLQERKFPTRAQTLTSELSELVEAQDIAIGMPSSLVRKSWGEPTRIEVSGNPKFKNERWIYHKYISTPDGYKPETKLVFFEGGRVVGWEIQ